MPGASAALWGEAAEASRERGVLAPARRALQRRGSGHQRSLGLLSAVFQLGEALSPQQVDLALPSLGVEGARRLGLLRAVGSAASDDGIGWVAALSLNPVELPTAHRQRGETGEPEDSWERWWVLSDLDDHLREGAARPDHVMGVGGATRTLLAQGPWGATERGFTTERVLKHPTIGPRGEALDLGTGCGVVAMYLARAGFERVVATDISDRALMFARANVRLNRIGERHGDGEIEFRQGSLFEPLEGERFDLILSNPPFVITPRSSDSEASRVPHYDYRDGGMVGDALAEAVVRGAPLHLREGGTLVCLANWESVWGANGLERVRAWIADTAKNTGALAAWVLERERLDPARYAETWSRDGGARPGEPAFDALIDAWLEDFENRRIVAIGLGSIRLQRLRAAESAAVRPVIRVEHASQPFAERPGLDLSTTFTAAVCTEYMEDELILASKWCRRIGVSEQREHIPGEEAPRSITITTDTPLARTVQADPLLAAAIGACDGDLTLGQIVDALATLLEVDAEQTTEALVSGVRELVWLGMLQAADD